MKKYIIFATLLPIMALGTVCEKIELEGNSNYIVNRCPDGTVSTNQYSHPKSKKSDYEGLCGPTAAANVYNAYCNGYFRNPKKLATKYFSDITPGTRPDTLTSGLNKLFDNDRDCMGGNWKYYYSKTRWDFLRSLKNEVNRGHGTWIRTTEEGSFKKSPVIVLLSKKSNGKVLHYVTVVDIRGYVNGEYESDNCIITYNDFGRQSRVQCRKFVKWANQVDNHTMLGWLPEYIHIVFEPGLIYNFLEKIEAELK